MEIYIRIYMCEVVFDDLISILVDLLRIFEVAWYFELLLSSSRSSGLLMTWIGLHSFRSMVRRVVSLGTRDICLWLDQSWSGPRGGLGGAGFTAATGLGPRHHPVRGGCGSSPVWRGGGVFVVGLRGCLGRAARASCESGWRWIGLRWRRGGRRWWWAGREFDGGVDEGEALGDVFCSGLAAFGQVHVDVVGGWRRAWSTGRRRLWGFDVVFQDGVVGGWEDVSESTSSVEVWVKGSCVGSFFDAPSSFVALRVQTCHIFRAEVMLGDAGVLADGGVIFVRAAFDFA